MAMRMNWEGSPNFALAVGGLHPAFNPPPNFPKLARIAISLASGDNPRLRCEAYFALTANTVQFGARMELYASASGFSIQGETGFDVLIQLDPFMFLAEFYAQVQLKRGSTNLFKVRSRRSADRSPAAARQGQGHVRNPVVGHLDQDRQDAGRR